MTAADFMYISYGLPTAPFPLVPIPTLSLCLGRVGGCPVVGGSHAMSRPACPHPPVPSLPMGVGLVVGGCVDNPVLLLGGAVTTRLRSASSLVPMSLKGRAFGVQNSPGFLGRFLRSLPSLGVSPFLRAYTASRSSIS